MASSARNFDGPKFLQSPLPNALPMPPSSWIETLQMEPVHQPYPVWLKAVEQREREMREAAGGPVRRRRKRQCTNNKPYCDGRGPQKWSRAELSKMSWDFAFSSLQSQGESSKLEAAVGGLSNLTLNGKASNSIKPNT